MCNFGSVKYLLAFASLMCYVLVQCCNQNTFKGTELTALKDVVLKDEITDYNYFTEAKRIYHTIIPIYHVTGCITPAGGFINAVAIQIRGATVPVFYEGAIQALPYLHSIHVISCEVTILEPGAFQNLPSLTVIKIQDNNIPTIPAHLFNGLMVKKLILTFNNISNIHPEAFKDMPRLESIHLDFNRISNWNADWFWNCPKVGYLSLKFNQLTSLPGRAFRNIQDTLQRLYLSHNDINYINPRAFTGLRRLTDLSLNNNLNLTVLDDLTFLYLENLKLIDLSETSMMCFSDSLLNTLRSDVLLWIDNIPLDTECQSILDRWTKDNQNNLTFYKNVKNGIENIEI